MEPTLSIIIPTLDEATVLPRLLADLAKQQGIDFEILIIDGGSKDMTEEIAVKSCNSLQLLGRVIIAARGRGQQLNRGADEARGQWLFFLHADSRLPDPKTLKSSVDLLEKHAHASGNRISAGHLSLAFDLPDDQRSFAFRFYELKAHSGRQGTIHGDQGMFIRRVDFLRTGGFREDLPVMEDSCFAEAVRGMGDWLLLPGRILTSPRRFQVEGMSGRQTLNALMMNFLAIGWDDFFAVAPDIYRRQSRTAPVELLPFFYLISELLSAMPFSKRWTLWASTGAYVRSQAWQLGLYLDGRRQNQQGLPAEQEGHSWLKWFDRWFEPLTDHKIGHLMSALLVRFWFAWTFRRLRNRSPVEEQS